MIEYINKIKNKIEKNYTNIILAGNMVVAGLGLGTIIEGLLREDVRTDVYVGMGLAVIVMNVGCASLIYAARKENKNELSKLEQNLKH